MDSYPKRTPCGTWPVRDTELVEVGEQVAYFTKGMHPIHVKDSEINLYSYQARQVAELLLRPDARDIGEQLLLAANMFDAEKEQRESEQK